jgi:hypothetical protein
MSEKVFPQLRVINVYKFLSNDPGADNIREIARKVKAVCKVKRGEGYPFINIYNYIFTLTSSKNSKFTRNLVKIFSKFLGFPLSDKYWVGNYTSEYLRDHPGQVWYISLAKFLMDKCGPRNLS